LAKEEEKTAAQWIGPSHFPVELGWVMVEERFRRQGLGKRVMDALLGSPGEERLHDFALEE